MSKFTNPQRIVRGFAAALIGVWVYCLVVAPLLSDAPYMRVAMNKAENIGLGFSIAIVVVAIAWIVVASVVRSRRTEH